MARRIVSGVLAAVALACGGERERLPADLIGTWRTSSPGFHESYFELREGFVVFGADRYRISMYPIQAVESSRVSGGTEYAIEYQTDDGALLPLIIVYSPGSPPRLRIGHRPDIWFPASNVDAVAQEDS